jgi:pilus assembly protein CpaE
LGLSGGCAIAVGDSNDCGLVDTDLCFAEPVASAARDSSMNMLSPNVASVSDDLEASAGRERFAAFLADERSERVVRQCVTDMALSFSSVHRGDIASAIAYLEKTRSPKALMVDISGVEPALTKIQTLAEVCEPGVSVVAVGDRNDVGLFRDLLAAGISDYIVKPLPAPLVQSAINGVLGDVNIPYTPLGQKLGTVHAVVGIRGGIGASTIATNLAWSLANKKHRRVALVDLDLKSGSCGLMLGINAIGGLREAMERPERVDELFLHRAAIACSNRLSLLCGEPQYLEPVAIHPAALAPLVSLLRKEYHYVVLDVPRGDDVLFKQVLDLASTRVVVLDQTTLSIRDMLGLQDTLKPRQDDQRNLVVLNRVGESGKGGISITELEEILHQKIDATVPFDSKSVIAAANAGVPLVAGRSNVAKAMERIAEDLGGHGHAASRPWWKVFGK